MTLPFALPPVMPSVQRTCVDCIGIERGRCVILFALGMFGVALDDVCCDE